MKKNKLFSVLMLLVISLLIITGCEKKEEEKIEDKPLTPVNKIVEIFNENNKENDIEKIASTINDKIKDIIVYETDIVTLNKKDYVEGFDYEIKDFEEAVAIKPLISGQPFIAYIFKTNNPKDLESTLKEHADLRWNICTQADEFETSVYEDYVFFVMTKKDFSEE